MEICVKSFDGEKYTVDVGVDDTTADIRRKVASAAELCEDGFDVSFGGKLLAEGDDITQLSAGDTVVLTKTKSQKDDAIAALRDLGETRLTKERFKDLTDPKLIHLFLQAEVVAELPSRFLAQSRFKELDLSGVPGVTRLCSGVLANCNSLRTADLSGWSNVTHIESFLLNSCSALQTVDLSGWNNVTHIGSYFLQGCRALTRLDLSGGKVTLIDYNFLSNCTSLTALDISGWKNVTQVGHSFLSDCSALRTVDLSGWSNVTQVGHSFLGGCTSLTTLDLSGWSNVTQIGRSCLSNCSALTTLDLSGWTNAKDIGTGTLKGCNIPTSSINTAGSSIAVSEYMQSSRLMGDTKPPSREGSQLKCVCM